LFLLNINAVIFKPTKNATMEDSVKKVENDEHEEVKSAKSPIKVKPIKKVPNKKPEKSATKVQKDSDLKDSTVNSPEPVEILTNEKSVDETVVSEEKSIQKKPKKVKKVKIKDLGTDVKAEKKLKKAEKKVDKLTSKVKKAKKKEVKKSKIKKLKEKLIKAIKKLQRRNKLK